MKKNAEFAVNTEIMLLPFLLSCFSGNSRNYVKGILKRGQITVNEELCMNYGHTLYPGQRVRLLKKTTLEKSR